MAAGQGALLSCETVITIDMKQVENGEAVKHGKPISKKRTNVRRWQNDSNKNHDFPHVLNL